MAALIIILRPFSWLYGLILRLRHRLYDKGLFKSSPGPLPTIVIGNLELGGTGKTPLTELVIRTLKSEFKVALLSRGYGRKTKGFLPITAEATAEQVGDEPLLLKTLHPDVPMAVCEDRLDGLHRLADSTPLEMVVLDDAFQHRALHSGFNVLLTPYQRPFWENHLVPEGSLRDVKHRARHAHVLIVSKCPSSITEAEMNAMREKIAWYSTGLVFFSAIRYGALQALFSGQSRADWPAAVVLFSGLADDSLLKGYVSQKTEILAVKNYPDHHRYGLADLHKLKEICANFAGRQPSLVTTAKDAVKIRGLAQKEDFSDLEIWVLPIEVQLINEGFEETIKAYARANKRDS